MGEDAAKCVIAKKKRQIKEIATNPIRGDTDREQEDLIKGSVWYKDKYRKAVKIKTHSQI